MRRNNELVAVVTGGSRGIGKGVARARQSERTKRVGCMRFRRIAAERLHWTTLQAPRFAVRH